MLTFAWEVINYLIDKKSYKSYLEIGTHKNATFDKIVCDTKVGVDPSFDTNFRMTSDRFFAQNDKQFDLIFIDGDHRANQVKTDILNSLKALTDDGCIILHDVNPREERLVQSALCWDAWYGFAQLRMERDDLLMCTLDFDYIGYISFGKMDRYTGTIENNWKYLDANRKELMNEMTWDEFSAFIGQYQKNRK